MHQEHHSVFPPHVDLRRLPSTTIVRLGLFIACVTAAGFSIFLIRMLIAAFQMAA